MIHGGRITEGSRAVEFDVGVSNPSAIVRSVCTKIGSQRSMVVIQEREIRKAKT